MLSFNPVVPIAGPVVLGSVDNIPAILPVVWVRIVFRVKGIEVNFAKRASSPSSHLQRLHEGRNVGIEPVAIGEQTMAAAGQPRGNARPSRTADWVVGEGIGECYAHTLEASQVRQVADAVHGCFQPLGSHLINHEKDDVGFVRCVHKVLSIDGDPFSGPRAVIDNLRRVDSHRHILSGKGSQSTLEYLSPSSKN